MLDVVQKVLGLAALVIVLLILLQFQGCEIFGKTAGPMTMTEAMAADLEGVTELQVIAEGVDPHDPDNDAKVAGVKAGVVAVLRSRGYGGEIVVVDVYGNAL